MQRLGVSKPEACGVLELLWHFAATYAMAGDVGRWSDAAIAERMGWKGDPASLMRALVASRFVDEDVRPGVRLIVHDWSEHAEDYVHKALCRALKTFADGRPPSDKRLSKKERAEIKAKSAQSAPNVRPASAQPGRAVPGQGATETNPPQTPPAGAGGARARTKAQASTIADQLAARYRERLGKAPGRRLVRHWRTELRQGVSEGAIGALIEAAAAEERRQAESDAAEQARWDQAREWIERHGGRRVIARAALDWVERNRGPDESVNQALARWCREGGFPDEVLGEAVKELYELRREGLGERSPPAPTVKATAEHVA